jgi:lipopolysaccharide transport system ATP-binding protein
VGSQALIAFDQVWKKFRKGERHDSLRDLIPALVGGVFKSSKADDLADQEFWALRNVSFEVRSGEALGIIGPNGAGKSTALKILTGILGPTKGERTVRGHVGALIEVAAGFHPDLTGRENIFLQGAIMGLRRREVVGKLDEIIAFSGINDFVDTPVKRYSSGMNARLGFAIATALNPDVLLIDEVLAVGDLSFQQKCYERLARYRKEGTAIAFVSHSMQAVASICDRVLLLRRGADPLLGRFEEVVPEYLSASAPADSTRARLVSSELAEVGNSGRFAPGREVRLSCRITALEDLPRCGWGIQVIRSDGLAVFECGSTLERMTPVNLRGGDSFDATIGLRVHLDRGLYNVKVHLYDEERKWPAIDLGTAGSIVVESGSKSTDSIAYLAPEFSPVRLQDTQAT